jgi:hypothetical protein
MAVVGCAATLTAQQRPPLSRGVALYESVNAPIVALTHVRVVDGTGAPARDDQTIVIRGEQIDAVGAASSTRIPSRWTFRPFLRRSSRRDLTTVAPARLRLDPGIRTSSLRAPLRGYSRLDRLTRCAADAR